MASQNIGVKLIMSATDAARALGTAKKELVNLRQTTKDYGKDIEKSFSTSSILGWATVIKTSISTMLKASNAQAQYVEELNMMDVAFGKTANSANAFVESLSKSTGFDESTLVKQLGVYRQFGAALNIDSKSADTLAKNLLKLQLDTASLYGISLNRAGEILQSTMAGNTKSIRQLGGDITEASLQQEAYRLGIDKTVESMNRSEKSILIYLTIEKQLSNVNGDTSRTINSVANQTKIFTEQISKAARQLGGLFIPILKGLLPILNGLLMAFNEITGMLLSMFGVDATQLANEFGTATSSIDDMSDSLDNSAEAADKAKNSLRGFDKLNVITTPTKSGGSGSALGGVDPKLLSALKDYNMQLDKMQNKATEVRDRIMEWLGFTKNVNQETGEIYWTFNNTSGIDFTNLSDSWNNFTTSVGEFTSSEIIPALKWFYDNVLVPLAQFTINELIPHFFDLLAAAVDAFGAVIDGFKDPMQWMWDNFLNPIMKVTEWAIIALLQGLTDALKGFSEWAKNNQDIMKVICDLIMGFIAFLATQYIKGEAILLIQTLITVFGAGGLAGALKILNIPLLVSVAAFGALIWALQSISQNWDKMNGAQRVISVLGALAIAAVAAAAAFGALQSAWTLGVAAIAIVGGIIAIKTAISSAERDAKSAADSGNVRISGGFRANGGFVNKGQVFVANEKGAEMVGSMDGKTAVANNQQITEGIKQATRQGFMEALNSTSGNKSVNVNITAEGDASGLLDFITFTQNSKNRQFDL